MKPAIELIQQEIEWCEQHLFDPARIEHVFGSANPTPEQREWFMRGLKQARAILRMAQQRGEIA